MKINYKVITVNFYKYALEIRVVNRNDSDIFECHLLNSEYQDFINTYKTDFFVINKQSKTFYRNGLLTSEEVYSIWNQIVQIFNLPPIQEINID